MQFTYIPHALQRMSERGTNKREVEITIKSGIRKPDKLNRIKSEQVFTCNKKEGGISYKFKQVVVTAELINKLTGHWKIITVVVKYYN